MPTTQRFGLQRKIVANMTAESWNGIPHACVTYEAEATGLLIVLGELNASRSADEAITINTAMLKVVAEGILACPKMNGHIRYSRLLAGGSVTRYETVDVTMPVALDEDTMITLNIRGVERKTIPEIQNAVTDSIRRAKNSHLDQALYEVALYDTLKELKRLRLLRALGRFLGFWLEGGPRSLLHGAEKHRYLAIPETERLTRRDLEQGTVTVTNIGVLFRQWNVVCTMLELIPPMIASVVINSVQDRTIVDPDGTIRAAKILPLTIAFDHRALDASDIVPFMARLDQIFSEPEKLKDFM